MITINAGFARIPAKAARAKLSATDWAVLHVIGLHADNLVVTDQSNAVLVRAGSLWAAKTEKVRVTGAWF